MNYRINYNVVLCSETLYDKEIIVKNKSNELIAKCSLEDYLKRKFNNNFIGLVINDCREEMDVNELFNNLFKFQ